MLDKAMTMADDMLKITESAFSPGDMVAVFNWVRVHSKNLKALKLNIVDTLEWIEMTCGKLTVTQHDLEKLGILLSYNIDDSLDYYVAYWEEVNNNDASVTDLKDFLIEHFTGLNKALGGSASELSKLVTLFKDIRTIMDHKLAKTKTEAGEALTLISDKMAELYADMKVINDDIGAYNTAIKGT